MKLKLGIAALTLLLAACSAGAQEDPAIAAAAASGSGTTLTDVALRDNVQSVRANATADKPGKGRRQGNAANSSTGNAHAPNGSAVAAGSAVSVGETVSGYTVTISGGFTTDSRDNGRPIKLIAAGLGVTDEVFREAFSGVTPARDGDGPTGEEARANKTALMKVLAPYGITNERLDEVSNYYRYKNSNGEMWKHTLATAIPVVANGKVTSIKLVNAGAGYSSSPTVTVTDPDGVKVTATVKLAYSQTLATNGSIASITLP